MARFTTSIEALLAVAVGFAGARAVNDFVSVRLPSEKPALINTVSRQVFPTPTGTPRPPSTPVPTTTPQDQCHENSCHFVYYPGVGTPYPGALDQIATAEAWMTAQGTPVTPFTP